MSSEAITRNDLKAILEQCGMSGIAFQEAAVMNITYATITSTTNAIRNPDNSVILGNTNIFSIDSSTNRVIINKNCTCLVLTSVVFSAVTNANNVRLLTLGKNSSTTEIVQAAISHGVAWESHMAAHYHNFSEGDEAHFIVRAEDGNSTLREGHTILIPIKSQIDTVSYDLCPDYIVAQPSEDLTFSTNETTVVNLNTISRSNGSKLTFDANSHAIVVGEGVKFVEISGAAYILTWGNTAAKNVYIYVNDICYGRTTGYINTNYNSLVISPVIVPVSEGDLVTLRFNPSNNSTSVLGHDTSDNGATTFLQVKVADMSGKISVSLPEDYIIDEGTTDGWAWRKWNSGRYEAEKYENYGTVSADNALVTVEGSVKLYITEAIPTTIPTPPHTLTSGIIHIEYIGNTQGYSVVLKNIDGRLQLGRFGSAAFDYTGIKFNYRVINGRWK